VAKERAPDPEAAGSPVSWRELAVARSLDSARTRAETRVQRFLDASIELMNEGGRDFTVQEVVERSGQSLRSFYQYFGGKHELLLALFEETVRTTTDQLRKSVDQEHEAGEQLHRFVVEYYRLCRPIGKGPKKAVSTPALVDFAQQLLTGYPAEAAAAFAPLVTLFGELLDAAGDAGAVRPGLRHGPIAGIVLEAIMFNAFSTTIGGPGSRGEGVDPAEELWEVILHGIGSPDA
jgi:AcrR family transcriptional regulator